MPLRLTPPNREIDFDFDFDSIVRAGEAKLRERVRGVPPQRWVCEREEMRLLLLLLVRLFAQFKQYLVRVLSFISFLLATMSIPRAGFKVFFVF